MKLQKLGKDGFSLIELMFSIAIVATSLLFFIGIFFALFKSSQKGVDLTAGTVVAESELSRFLYSTQEDNADGLEALKTMTFPVTGTTQLNQTVFTHEISSTPMDTDGDLQKVDITVWWWQTEGEEKVDTKEGYGRLSVSLSRLVFTKYKTTLVK